jgi:Zn-dependent peptidase ImmA (M78 family)
VERNTLVGTHGFSAARLRQAMQRARKTGTAVAQHLNVTPNTVSRYLKGDVSPRPDMLRQIADFLGEPLGFFLHPMPEELAQGSAPFMRSYAAATKRARLSAEALKDRTRELALYLDRYVDLPKARFPEFRYGDDPAAVSMEDIEHIANETRRFWGLGDGPLANVVHLAEHHGAVVVRVDLGDATLDAFSQWGTPEERPYIILGHARGSVERSRFDAAHEIGHMVLHRHLPKEVVMRPEVHKLIEAQAERFGGAFLMPAESFRSSVYLTTISALRELKSVWGTSIDAMIVRLEQLGLVSNRQARRLWVAYAPYRQGETRATGPVEMPTTVRQSFEIVRNECGVSPAQLAADLPFSQSDIATIASLPIGYFRAEQTLVRAKERTGNGAVLEFRRKPGGV